MSIEPGGFGPSVSPGMDERYRIEDLIGNGGTSSVYRAFDSHLDRPVAVKRLHSAPDSSPAAGTRDDSLWREARVLSSLQHPNIVTIHDYGADSEGPFVVMELIDGETLDQVVERAPLPQADFLTVARETLEALVAAHSRDILHRDIKPGNVMLQWLPRGIFQTKLLDFGLAKASTKPSLQTIDHGGGIYGSIYFMAPEQFERAELDARTDLYSLGATFYYALTASFPFDGETGAEVMAAHLQHRLRPLSDLRPDLPPALCAWVERLTQRLPEDRPDSAAHALCELDILAAAAFHPAPAPATAPRAHLDPVSTSRSPARSLTVFAVVIPLALLGGYLTHRFTTPAPAAGLATAEETAPEPPAPPESRPVSALDPTPRPTPTPAPVAVAVPPSPPTPEPVPPSPAAAPELSPFDLPALRDHIDQTVILQGQIVRAGESKSGKTRYLNFSNRPGESAAIAFRVSELGSRFSMEELRALEGKNLRIEGTLVRLFDDLLIFVNSEDQLTQLKD